MIQLIIFYVLKFQFGDDRTALVVDLDTGSVKTSSSNKLPPDW